MNINQPLRTLTRLAHTDLLKARSKIDAGQIHCDHGAIDYLVAVEAYLDGVAHLCDRYEPIHIAPEEDDA